jgi:hypothetical protein
VAQGGQVRGPQGGLTGGFRSGSVRDTKPCPRRRQLSSKAVAGCGRGGRGMGDLSPPNLCPPRDKRPRPGPQGHARAPNSVGPSPPDSGRVLSTSMAALRGWPAGPYGWIARQVPTSLRNEVLSFAPHDTDCEPQSRSISSDPRQAPKLGREAAAGASGEARSRFQSRKALMVKPAGGLIAIPRLPPLSAAPGGLRYNQKKKKIGARIIRLEISSEKFQGIRHDETPADLGRSRRDRHSTSA